jgi:hypothetical protein
VRYFLDTEFYEDGRAIDLISIAVVAEDGRQFYAVSQDAQLHRVSPWVRENVLPRLPKYGDPAWMPRVEIADRLLLFTGQDVPSRSSPMMARLCADSIRGDKPEFWAYYADYDWVALCQLFGTMMDLPQGWPKFCRDLKQLSVDVGSPKHPPDPAEEHNALADAWWNRDLYVFLMAIKSARG